MKSRLLGGRYLLESEVARGGMAVVWRAVDQVLGRTVAAKVLHEHLTSDDVFRERFRIEALAAARLTHPNIISVFDTGTDEGTPFIVMEFLAGGTLKDVVAAAGRLEPAAVAEIGAQACAALAYAHRLGVVHRDIKPANILFSEHGHLKVSDFGIAKAAFAQANLTDSGAVLGTVRYLAPEQVEGIEPDGRADLYSLAVVLYEALTGRAAFSGDNEIATATARMESLPPPPRSLRPDVPASLDRAIMRCLAPARDQRFADAEEFAAALQQAAADQDGQTTGSRKKRRSPEKGSPPRPPRHAPPRPSPSGSFLRTEAGWLVPTVLMIILAAGLIIAVPSLRDRVGRVIPDLPFQAEPEVLKIQSSGTYDPPPGDGSENDDQVARAFDSDRSTAWRTSNYRTEQLGGLKDGVGIFFDLGTQRSLAKITVYSISGGWQASVRTSDDGRRWTDPGNSETAGQQHDFKPQGSHRYWMVWITRLTRTPGGESANNPYSVAITEIVPAAE